MSLNMDETIYKVCTIFYVGTYNDVAFTYLVKSDKLD